MVTWSHIHGLKYIFLCILVKDPNIQKYRRVEINLYVWLSPCQKHTLVGKMLHKITEKCSNLKKCLIISILLGKT
jgi:hypothetical protein